MGICREEETRTAMLLGTEALDRLHRAHVIVFGVGGVGGYVCEALARAGVGAITIVDRDTVSLSNINRQIIALHSTVGKSKVEVMKARMEDISPLCKVTARAEFYLPESEERFPLSGYDYIVDAIDTVSAKISLAVRASKAGIPIISAMGAGNKLTPEGFRVTDLAKTSGCPLARVMRRELRQRGIQHLKVVYSEEPGAGLHEHAPDNLPISPEGRCSPGSLPFIPGIAGLMLAGEVIKDLCRDGEK